ncbi:MAG: M23 family metallopeptidase [Flavobacterium sp.]|jgi:murein DD-endopeptidase MepM/ murein hydrolase activator NlpD|uniref:M23 family metallopeptidase n=1 Tax=Flavobacterium sp. TaxID=239 RepID=UPI003BA6D61D
MKYYLLITIFASQLTFSQHQFPKTDFISPLDIPLSLSGTFGELRSNHFHSGLDFRTQQKEGLNVYAIADGYISRIKISTFGYGKAIYITHENGYTSVYGHLQRASGNIQSYIKQQHYQLQQFEMDIFPQPDELQVKKGEIIGLSGNSGGSGGPHLHFEIRDTATEKIINPFYFGFDSFIKDTKAPVINEIIVYPISDDAVVNQSQLPISLPLSLQKDGTYLASKVKAKGTIGFGINTYDQSDNNYGKNGVFKITSVLDGKNSFEVDFSSFAFDETRYVNAYIDYTRYKKLNQRVQQLFYHKKYPLSIISAPNGNGIILVENNLSHVYQIEVIDFHGNKSKVNVPIQFANSAAKIVKPIAKTEFKIKSEREHYFKKENVSIYFPENVFYHDTFLNIDVTKGILKLHDETIPVHANFSIAFQNDTIPEIKREKYFIASVSGAKKSYHSTKIKGNTFTTWVKNLGQYQLLVDMKAPSIKPINFEEGKWISKQNTIQFSISDDLSGIKTYNGFLNGKWILLDYDFKTNTITHDFSDNVVIEGKNDLKIEVVDNVGNSTIFETHFYRSQKP